MAARKRKRNVYLRLLFLNIVCLGIAFILLMLVYSENEPNLYQKPRNGRSTRFQQKPPVEKGHVVKTLKQHVKTTFQQKPPVEKVHVVKTPHQHVKTMIRQETPVEKGHIVKTPHQNVNITFRQDSAVDKRHVVKTLKQHVQTTFRQEHMVEKGYVVKTPHQNVNITIRQDTPVEKGHIVKTPLQHVKTTFRQDTAVEKGHIVKTPHQNVNITFQQDTPVENGYVVKTPHQNVNISFQQDTPVEKGHIMKTPHQNVNITFQQEPPVGEGHIPKTPNQNVQTTRNVDYVDPTAFVLKNRFDIIVKTVYAIFLHRGNVPNFVKNMYNRLLEVSNTLKEPYFVDKASAQEWHNVKNSSAEDFQLAFSEILASIANDGFNISKSVVALTSEGVPFNGADRIASAIALGLPTMAVQRVYLKAEIVLSHDFLIQRGFEKKYAEFAMLQYTLQVSTTSTIIMWPAAASDAVKMKQARVMVQTCGDVMYEKTIKVTRTGVAGLAKHAYRNFFKQLGKIKDLDKALNKMSGFSIDNMSSISIIFLRPKSEENLLWCKSKLRDMFALNGEYDVAVHSPDYHDEVIRITEMVLNPNSVMFLNHHEGDVCKYVAKELIERLKSPQTNHSLVPYVLPQDIMMVSLWWSNDVDLLFQGKVNYESMLGNQRGISVHAHSFEHTKTKRAWGAEHLDGCTIDDFFTDPQYYGYCQGLKFVYVK